MERVAYFVVRARVAAREGDAPAELSGVVERLATGEKRAFASGEELLLLLTEWVGRPDSSGGRDHR